MIHTLKAHLRSCSLPSLEQHPQLQQGALQQVTEVAGFAGSNMGLISFPCGSISIEVLSSRSAKVLRSVP